MICKTRQGAWLVFILVAGTHTFIHAIELAAQKTSQLFAISGANQYPALRSSTIIKKVGG